MKITHLKVDGLFGLYNYDIDCNCHNNKYYFSVLTSPNGYGKTTLLRILYSLDVRRLFFLYILKYKTIVISFDDGSELNIQETDIESDGYKNSDTRKDQRRDLLLIWNNNGSELCRFNYQPEQILKAIPIASRKIMERQPFIGEIDEDNLELFTNDDAGEALNVVLAQMQNQEQFLLQLATIQIVFIGANRIYSQRRPEMFRRNRIELPILHVVKELKETLSKWVFEFQKNFQRLDSKLIYKLLEDKGTEISETEYNKKALELNQLIDELSSFGLSSKQSLPLYQHEKSKILDVYLNLMEEKLSFYKDLLPLVKLFNKNIQQKHFANKTIRLSVQHGIRIESSNGDILRADLLSTGEQNQIVMLYDLLFRTPKGGILLIDEPESSLHVAWQNDFVNDMQVVADSKNLQIIVATHSPIIVSNMPDDKVFDLFYLQSE